MRRKPRLKANQIFSRSSRPLASGRYNLFCLLCSSKKRLTWALCQIEDAPGNDEITIHRKFGNEQYVLLHERGAVLL